MTEKLLTGTLSLNTTNQPTISDYFIYYFYLIIQYGSNICDMRTFIFHITQFARTTNDF